MTSPTDDPALHESGKNSGHQAASGVIVVPNRPSKTAARTYYWLRVSGFAGPERA
jgi:hypothetical protein